MPSDAYKLPFPSISLFIPSINKYPQYKEFLVQCLVISPSPLHPYYRRVDSSLLKPKQGQ